MPVSPDEALNAAMQALQGGDPASAERLLRAILQRVPEDPQALHLHALIAFQKGELDSAARIWRRLARRFPDCAEFHYNLGIVLEGLGTFPEAESAYRRALAANPGWADAHYNLGLLLRRQQRLQEAVASFRSAIEHRPGHPESHNNLGEALLELGSIDEARASLTRALELQPDFAKAHNNLGKASSLEKRFAEAAHNFEHSLALDPGSAPAWNNLGLALHSMGESERAVQAFERALEVRPEYLTARWNLCTSRLKVIYRDQDDALKSRDAYRRDLEGLESACRLDSPGAIAEAAEAVGSTQPFYLAYQGEIDRDLQIRYGALVARIMAARYPVLARAKKRKPLVKGEPMRVGFVSRWFVRHSVWKIPVRGWIQGFDRTRFQLYAYHTGHERDDQTEEAERLFDRFVQGPLALESWCERIRRDDLHVLVFPEIGMDPLTVKLAALRLAPVQCSTWGHPVTTGLPTIDYYLSSDLMEPHDAAEHYSERLVRLPNLSICYDPLPVPQVQRTREQFGLPADSVLYWCPQSIYKYLPRYDEVFPRIAGEVPGSRFLFIRYADGDGVNEVFQERLAKAFAGFGLSSAEHCIHLPRLNSAGFDAVSGLCDIFLDSIGWSGCNTTLEAIARDLPVVTFPGPTMRSRHSAAVLARMDITGTTAGSLDEYVHIAAAMGTDPARRVAARAEIHARKHLLYHDLTCIRALEDFLSSPG
jgi:predicted O-linked N-acetylglucosamine transferase (SPINDLY family)